MNAKELFAATLKDRKGLGPRTTGRNDPPAPAPPDRPGPARGPRPRSFGRHDFQRLELELRTAKKRAAKAEAALAALKAKAGTLWEKNREIARLRAAARVRLKPLRDNSAGRMRDTRAWAKLHAALNRIDALEAENEKLRKLNKGDA